MSTLDAVLVAYEYIITFDQEVAQVWMRKPTATSFLLLSTRWIMVLGPLISIIPPEPNTCKRLSREIYTLYHEFWPPDALVPIIVQAFIANTPTT